MSMTMSPVNAYAPNYSVQGSPKPQILNPYISNYLSNLLAQGNAAQWGPIPVGGNLDLKKMAQQMDPNATPPQLQAFRDAMLAGMIASDTAFKDAILLTGGKMIDGKLTGGNLDIAFEKKAEANFDVAQKMLNATPEGQSLQQRADACPNPFQVPTQPQTQTQPWPIQIQPTSAIPNTQPITV